MKNNFVIIGGGIAGLTTAIALQKIGIKATIVEAAHHIKPVGAGLSLASNAMLALNHLNLANEVIAQGRELQKFSIYSHNGKLLNQTNMNKKNSQFEFGNYTIHRADLQSVLLGKLENNQLVTGKKTIKIEQTNNSYTIHFTDNTCINANYIIIAEGINSVSRNLIFPNVKKRFSGYTCWRGVIDNSVLKVSETSETWGPNRPFGIVPLKHNKIYWFACKNAKAPNMHFKNFTIKQLHENFKSYHYPIPQIIEHTKPTELIWNDIFDLKPMPNYASKGILLIGDAAHATTPNMGQGACMAIEDAVVLLNCLKNNKQVEQAFLCFEQKRLKRTHAIVNKSWQLGKTAQIENNFLIRLRNLALSITPNNIFRKQLQKVYHVDFN